MSASKKKAERKKIIFVAVVVSIILYLTGVFSGLYANKIFEEKTQKDINSFKIKTQEDIKELKNITKSDLESIQRYINFLEQNLKTSQFDQLLIETLDKNQKCEYINKKKDNMIEELNYFWVKLPFRLEEYEKYYNPSEEYLELKKQYIPLSIKTWVLAKNANYLCKTNFEPILYFYSKDCDYCIVQGEELDKLRQNNSIDKKIIVFTIDFDYNDPMVNNVKELYKINKVPSLIISNKVLSGRLYTKEEIEEEIS